MAGFPKWERKDEGGSICRGMRGGEAPRKPVRREWKLQRDRKGGEVEGMVGVRGPVGVGVDLGSFESVCSNVTDRKEGGWETWVGEGLRVVRAAWHMVLRQKHQLLSSQKSEKKKKGI